jgi:hypothetical protein
VLMLLLLLGGHVLVELVHGRRKRRHHAGRWQAMMSVIRGSHGQPLCVIVDVCVGAWGVGAGSAERRWMFVLGLVTVMIVGD